MVVVKKKKKSHDHEGVHPTVITKNQIYIIANMKYIIFKSTSCVICTQVQENN